MRRIVTGFNSEGKSIVVADDEPKMEALESHPSAPWAHVWQIAGPAKLPQPSPEDVPRPASPRPVPGGTGVYQIIMKPNEVIEDGKVVGTKPNSEMHASLTVDFFIMQAGVLHMGLDGGEEVILKAGDVVVQNGTVHSWHNRGPEDVVALVIMLSTESAE